MGIWDAFKYSCLLPGKKAAFQLNRIPMDRTIMYIFLLVFAVSIPRAANLAAGGAPGSLNMIQFVFYFLFVYELLAACTVLAGISLLACCGYVLRKLMKRKLAYRHLWKMSCYTITVPLVLHTIIDEWMTKNGLVSGVVLGGYPLVCLVLMIRHYPAARHHQQPGPV
ncbi:DUF1189 family protein [Weizmannia acidilactici]|nr:DUF1189 family protein [Weizmannia acidilactici]